MSSNPFLSQWLSAANSAAGSWRGFWTAEFARQQAAMMTEWQRQAMQFWSGAWALPQVQAAASPVMAPTAAAAQPVPPPAPAPVEEATSAPEAAEPEAKPARLAKRPVQLRAAVELRKAPAKRATAKAPRRGRLPITRH
jgi:hypothetical protein